MTNLPDWVTWVFDFGIFFAFWGQKTSPRAEELNGLNDEEAEEKGGAMWGDKTRVVENKEEEERNKEMVE